MAPLPLDSAGLPGARAALATPGRRRVRAVAGLACAALMAFAAVALCAVVLLGGWNPAAPAGPPAGVRAPLQR